LISTGSNTKQTCLVSHAIKKTGSFPMTQWFAQNSSSIFLCIRPLNPLREKSEYAVRLCILANTIARVAASAISRSI
jgi:hypothetical protein